MTGLGEKLRQAREAKGCGLEDAERETRISRRYLQALEDEEFDVLPAPVYARGFLRSYSQYLGLDPQEVLPLFRPTQAQERVVEPLPELAPPQPQRANRLVIGGVVLVLVIAGVYLMLSVLTGGDSGDTIERIVTPVTQPDDAVAVVDVPDVRGKTLADAVAVLDGAGLTYVIAEVTNDDHDPGVVYAQDPKPGSEISQGQVVTLTANKGE